MEAECARALQSSLALSQKELSKWLWNWLYKTIIASLTWKDLWNAWHVFVLSLVYLPILREYVFMPYDPFPTTRITKYFLDFLGPFWFALPSILSLLLPWIYLAFSYKFSWALDVVINHLDVSSFWAL